MATEEKDFLANPPEALIAKWEAEARSWAAEAALKVLEAKRGKLIVEYETHSQAAKLEDLKRREATDDFARGFYYFGTDVNDKSVAACISRLKVWDRTGFDQPIEIMFSSGGGSIVDGMELYDYIQFARKRLTINTSTYGMAASMAAILLQAGETRKMGKEAWLMLHEGSMSVPPGRMTDVAEIVEFGKRLGERAKDIVLNRAAMVKDEEGRKVLTRAALDRRWKAKDWWVSSEEAWKLGLVDEIG